MATYSAQEKKNVCKNFIFAYFFKNEQILLRKNLLFVDLRTFDLVESEKMECEVILLWIEMRDEITDNFFTELCLYMLLI